MPNPNGPTLNDLEYGSYNQAGYVNVTQSIPGEFIGGAASPVSDAVNTRENVVLNFVGYTYSDDTSDFVNTSENVQVNIGLTGPNRSSISVSDSVTTSENIVTS